MLTRLTRLHRLRAGWLVALIYMLCVLAPTISFALPGSQAISRCLNEASHVPGLVHVHSAALTQHVHNAGSVHDHSDAHSSAISVGDHRSTVQNDKSFPGKLPNSSDEQCCGLTCVTAIPATLIDIVKPSAPVASCEVEGYRNVGDNASPRLYRPPIS